MHIPFQFFSQYFIILFSEFIDFHNDWPSAERQKFIEDMRILPDFLAPDEEERLLEEIEPYLKRMRYEFDHWDDVCMWMPPVAE